MIKTNDLIVHQFQYPLSITYHCIPQQWKQPKALQWPGTADWLILQQRILGLFTTEDKTEWMGHLHFCDSKQRKYHKIHLNFFLNAA